jgi:DNA-binding NtrC family response regulator
VTRETTLPETHPSSVTDHRPQTALVLSVAWCGDEPWRVGEVLLVPASSQGQPIWFGRGPSSPDRPKSPLGQLRPGQWLPSPPLGLPALSRYQLSLEADGLGRLVVRNAGRCPLLVNDTPAERAEIGAGDRVQLGRQLLFLCATRTLDQAPGQPATTDFPFGGPDANGIVGESPAAWELRRQIALTSGQAGHVLITGPSGSGKELVAQAIHARSARASRPIVARNAATLPESLIDAELFGNARNYPNPGMPERRGLIGEAHGSTLFLDELAELPHSAQAHLLRVLDAGEYQRLGETTTRTSDFRLIAATNRDPSSFKHDLLARLTFHIAVPGLDLRRDDLPLLVRHLLRAAPELGSGPPEREPTVDLEVMTRLLSHDFGTGLRELRSLLWQAITEPRQPAAGLAASPEPAPAAEDEDEDEDAPPGEAPPSADQVQRCLDQNNGALEPTWRALGLKNRYALQRLIKRYDVEVRRRPSRR